jgi:uncharacterized protein YndB with AHSA1/START domain
MDRVYTVTRQKMLAASPERAWPYLVDGALLSEWFADSGDVRPGGRFNFAFGDGDFFSGSVKEWDPPVSLGLEWRFLDVGPRFDIRFSLLPVGEETEITVQDRGAASPGEAVGLREGWDDFLMRCERIVRTGERSRYRWTDVFGGTAFIEDGPETLSRLEHLESWPDYFPGTGITVRNGTPGRLAMVFHDPAWASVATCGELKVSARLGRCCLHLTHRGWEDLPAEIQVAERRRYAAHWARLLKDIESGSLIRS